MSDATGRLALPYIVSSQAQKEVTHNQSLNILDVMLQPVVLEMGKDTPPESPAEGDCYVVGSSSTDEFVGYENYLAQYADSSWHFVAPFKWLDIVNEADDTRYTYNGSEWIEYALLLKDSGEYMRIAHLEETIIVSGTSTTSTIEIPDRALVLAVNSRVTTEVIGATSFDVGVSDDSARYGSGIGIALDSTNIGMSYHPITYYANTPIELTAQGSDFTGGVIKITVQYIEIRGPWDW